MRLLCHCGRRGEELRNQSLPEWTDFQATLDPSPSITRATTGRLAIFLGALVGVRCVPGVLPAWSAFRCMRLLCHGWRRKDQVAQDQGAAKDKSLRGQGFP